MVNKVEHVQKKTTAAAKVIPVKYEEELEDFVIEVDILTVCKQEGLIGLVGAHLWKGECERSPVGAWRGTFVCRVKILCFENTCRRHHFA